MEKSEGIASGLESSPQGFDYDANRLAYARVDGPSVTMAYMTEDKTHVCYIQLMGPVITRADSGISLLERTSGVSSSFCADGPHGQRNSRIRVHHVVLRERATPSTTSQGWLRLCRHVAAHPVADVWGIR